MNWQDIIKFNKEHLGKFVDNKQFWKRFNELENLFEVVEDDLRDYEKIKYITINEFLIRNKMEEIRIFIQQNARDIDYDSEEYDYLMELLKESGD